MSIETKSYNHVSYLWNEQEAAKLAGDEVALLIYRSNLLGADLRLTNYGGGNTSCKAIAKDPLTGNDTEVMWVKGSGGDLGTLKRNGLAALYVDKLRALKNIYRGLAHEDEMVELFNHCIYDLQSKAPSIDTPLHGFLPFKHIDPFTRMQPSPSLLQRTVSRLQKNSLAGPLAGCHGKNLALSWD
jgi:rhamnose utilization protein RhaD (predicted bifunctional aldolase and dehydrogenase)